jgi:hypothetical protein
MSDAQSIVIKDGKGIHKVGANASESTELKDTQRMPLQEDNLQATKQSITLGGKGDAQVHDVSAVRVAHNVSSQHEGAFGTIKNPAGQIENDMTRVTPKHSIEIDGIRGTLESFMSMGVVSRSESGEWIIGSLVVKEGEVEPAKPALHQTEDLKYHNDIQDLNYLHTKVTPNVTDAFIAKVSHAIAHGNGNEGQKAVSDYAQATGASEAQIEEFGNRYLSNLMQSGLDYTVRAGKGSVSTEQIEAHVDKCSAGFKASLILALHHNDLSVAKALIKMVRTGEIR